MNILNYLFSKSYRKHRWLRKNLSYYRMLKNEEREDIAYMAEFDRVKGGRNET